MSTKKSPGLLLLHSTYSPFCAAAASCASSCSSTRTGAGRGAGEGEGASRDGVGLKVAPERVVEEGEGGAGSEEEAGTRLVTSCLAGA